MTNKTEVEILREALEKVKDEIWSNPQHVYAIAQKAIKEAGKAAKEPQFDRHEISFSNVPISPADVVIGTYELIELPGFQGWKFIKSPKPSISDIGLEEISKRRFIISELVPDGIDAIINKETAAKILNKQYMSEPQNFLKTFDKECNHKSWYDSSVDKESEYFRQEGMEWAQQKAHELLES